MVFIHAISGAAIAATDKTSLKPAEKSGADIFLDYMKKSLAERMEEAWLKKHGLTKETLAQKSPEEQAAIREAMRQDIEESIRRQTAEKMQNEVKKPLI